MVTIAQRLAKLEERRRANGRQIIVSAYGEFGEAAATTFLAAQGVVPTDADSVVLFVTVYEDEDGQPAKVEPSPQLLVVRPL